MINRIGSITKGRFFTYRIKRILQAATLLFALLTVLSVWIFKDYMTNLGVIGYPGVFLLSLLGSVSMILPVPGLLSACGISAVLNPLLIAIASGSGETIGEVSGYAIGYGGGSFAERHHMYNRVKRWMLNRGILVIFIFSVIPNPLFDIVGITAGTVRFPIIRFFSVVLTGKLLKGLIVAYTCEYWITNLPWIG